MVEQSAPALPYRGTIGPYSQYLGRRTSRPKVWHRLKLCAQALPSLQYSHVFVASRVDALSCSEVFRIHGGCLPGCKLSLFVSGS